MQFRTQNRQLMLAVDANVLTDNVKENGMGLVDAERLKEAVAQLGETYEYENKPDAKLYFTDKYLPDGGFALN